MALFYRFVTIVPLLVSLTPPVFRERDFLHSRQVASSAGNAQRGGSTRSRNRYAETSPERSGT